MTERLAGRVAVVTGGGSGIGAECARRFVSEGARVVLGDLNGDALETMAKELGDDCATELVDVTDPTAVERLVARATDDFGRLDIGLNAAGIGWYSPVYAHAVEQWDAVVDVCLKGVFLSVRAESAAMLAAKSAGVIINIASINASVPAEGMSAYCAAKAGVVMLTQCAAMELGPHQVRVCGIAPGFIETPMTAYARDLPGVQDAYVESIPLGRAGAPGDIAAAAAFLASDDASWITGTTIYVDGAEANKGYPELARFIPGMS
ncbi:MAG TPA: glucose 1-dehydrogenase [Acidimicrobiia bacterium]|jgi:NAD(P)-dependent dehydrogenase (short-subunit alcohol dehydrogenase family)|nr:glucose 1-dehydrogenase [Acidimicrobiia bacterium]